MSVLSARGKNQGIRLASHVLVYLSRPVQFYFMRVFAISIKFYIYKLKKYNIRKSAQFRFHFFIKKIKGLTSGCVCFNLRKNIP